MENKIKFLGYLFVFIISFMFVLTEVSAHSVETYTNKCAYDVTDKKGKKAVIYVYPKGDYINSITIDNIEFANVGEGNHTIGADGEQQSRSSKIFVLDDSKLYCPSVVYFCYDGETNRLASTESSCKENPAKAIYNEDKSGGFAVKYELGDDGVGCSAGGSSLEKYLSSYKQQLSTFKSGVETLKCDSNINSNLETLNKGESTKSSGNKNDLASGFYKDDNSIDLDLTKNMGLQTTTSNASLFIKTTNEKRYCYFSTATKIAELNNLQNDIEAVAQNLNSKVSSCKYVNEEKKQSVDGWAESVEEKLKKSEYNVDSKDTKYNCDQLIDDDLKAVIQLVLKIVRIGAPILLIILVAVDFSQAVISNDNDATKKAVSKVIKRAIAALALFFIPYLVSVMLDWIDPTMYFDPETARCEEVLK